MYSGFVRPITKYGRIMEEGPSSQVIGPFVGTTLGFNCTFFSLIPNFSRLITISISGHCTGQAVGASIMGTLFTLPYSGYMWYTLPYMFRFSRIMLHYLGAYILRR